ncbi:MAG: pirin family protein [archaeon]
MEKKIKKKVFGRLVIEGAGVKLRRYFSNDLVKDTDPFLLFDDFSSDTPDDYLAGFPWHPHRGIETVTYVLEGRVEHKDSFGNSGIIGKGDVQWMTAGSGIIHEEMPLKSKRMKAFQLWVNLPREKKMCPPMYRSLLAKELPTADEKKTSVKVIAGKYKGLVGPVKNNIEGINYFDITLNNSSEFEYETQDKTVFCYIYEGSCDHANKNELIFFGKEGNIVKLIAGKQGCKFLLITGNPLNEPIAWAGPIVMNTQEELKIAFDELKEGTFIKHQ